MSRSPETVAPRGRVEDLPEWLWAEARAAEHRLLLIDYDGTLAPFRIDRLEARPHPGAARLLDRIVAAGRTRVTVISGRPVAELRRLLDVEGTTLVGEHGWERWSPEAGLVRHPLPAEVEAALGDVARAARTKRWGRRLEEKRTSLVLHARGLPVDEASQAARAFGDLWTAGGGAAGLRLQPIDGGVELRAAGHDKGVAVREILAACPTGVWPLYLGDERTDEDAFGALEGRGVAIRVGVDERPSLAHHRLAGPREVVEFLGRWVVSVEAGSAVDARGAS